MKNKAKILQEMREWANPYPKDVFTWGNTEPITLTRGRFNQFIHRVVENTRESLLTLVDDG